MNEMQPVVSVIIPTYNREKFIGEAINSVLDQTYHDFEIIVVDDGSTDRTRDIVMAFPGKVRYVHQTNQGRSRARNYALSLARGSYIAFLDSDDLYLPEKLALQVAYMDAHPEVNMIYTSAYCIDEDGAPLDYVYKAATSGWIYKDIAFFVPVTITLPTVMVRREVFDNVGGFDESMERFEDTDMWRRISKHYQIGAIRECTCRLRTHPDNALASQDPSQIVNALEYYIGKIWKEDAEIGAKVLRKGASQLYYYYGIAMMSKPNWRMLGRKLMTKALIFWPFSPRLLISYIYNNIRWSFKRAK